MASDILKIIDTIYQFRQALAHPEYIQAGLGALRSRLIRGLSVIVDGRHRIERESLVGTDLSAQAYPVLYSMRP